MKLTTVLFVATLFFPSQVLAAENQSTPYAGSKSCRECHERFYGLWSGSMHGLAMQPYTETWPRRNSLPRWMTWSSVKTVTGPTLARGFVLETGAGRQEKAVQDRLRPWRQERLLLPHPHGQRPPADPAGGLRRSQEGVVRHRPLRAAPLPRPDGGRNTGGVAGVSLHLQHLLLRLPCQPARHQLRPEDGQLQHHLERAGDQLRDLPRRFRGAQ